MDGLVGTLIGAAVGLGVFYVGMGWVAEYDKFNNWAESCNEAGGVVSVAEKRFSGTRYECFVNGEKVVIPGGRLE